VDQALRLRNPSVVLITNSFHGYAMLPYLRAVHPGRVFIDYNHMEEEYWREGGHVRWGVVYHSLLDYSFVSSNRLKAWMTIRGANASRIQVEPASVDLTEFVPSAGDRATVRSNLGMADGDVVVLYACRLAAQKQPLLAAEVMIRVLKRQRKEGLPLAKFLVGGTGPLAPDMEMYLRTSQLDRREQASIVHLGSVPAEEMRDLMQASDVLFLPSVMEGIPLTFFEAMALGVAIVGADVGANSELVVNGVTGILARYANITELAAKGDALAPSDPRFTEAAQVYADHLFNVCTQKQLRERMTAAAALRVRSFDIAISIRNIHERILELVETKALSAAALPAEAHVLQVATESYKLAMLPEYGGAPLLHPSDS